MSDFPIVDENNDNSTVGFGGGDNFQQAQPISWTTSGRPTMPGLGLSGYNSTINGWEFWNGTAWVLFSRGGGSGTVNSGTVNQIAWYAGTGTAVSGLATANSGVLVTSAGGVPSISTTLPSGLAMGTPASLVLTNATGLPIAGLTGLGTGVATALAINVGSAGAFVTFNGALGTPSSGVATNLTGYTIANLADVPWTDWSGAIGFTGFSANPTGVVATYKKIGKTCFINLDMTPGTSNANTFTITGLPFTSGPMLMRTCTLTGVNNSSYSNLIEGFVGSGSTTFQLAISDSSSGWTASGTKGIRGQFFYETV
jgi:hypothetical protein